jgi:hypothetical protein
MVYLFAPAHGAIIYFVGRVAFIADKDTKNLPVCRCTAIGAFSVRDFVCAFLVFHDGISMFVITGNSSTAIAYIVTLYVIGRGGVRYIEDFLYFGAIDLFHV